MKSASKLKKIQKSQCKKSVWSGNSPQGLTKHRCKRKAVKDGYCKIHQPDEIKKRNKHSENKLAATPFYLISKRK